MHYFKHLLHYLEYQVPITDYNKTIKGSIVHAYKTEKLV